VGVRVPSMAPRVFSFAPSGANSFLAVPDSRLAREALLSRLAAGIDLRSASAYPTGLRPGYAAEAALPGYPSTKLCQR